jgi:hypothetical protein
LKLRIIGSMAAQAVRWIPCGAFLGAACGALYGLPFAGLEALLEGESGRIIATTLYFAACGGVAGALVGGLAVLSPVETDSAPDESSSTAASRPQRITVIRNVTTSIRRPPVNRLTVLPSVDRRHGERAASRNPSRN